MLGALGDTESEVVNSNEVDILTELSAVSDEETIVSENSEDNKNEKS